MAIPSEWFCALLDTASEVYFRYALSPEPRGFVYISPSVEMFTGHAPAAFQNDRALIKRIVAPGDLPLMRRMLRSRRPLLVRLHLIRDAVMLPLDVRTVALVRRRRVIAVEGVARLASCAGDATSAGRSGSGTDAEPKLASSGIEPVQQRLAALMFEVHGLLHRMLPPPAAMAAVAGRAVSLGALRLDPDRLTVTESGKPVALTAREMLLLRYLLECRGRVVTRAQILTDVWSYSYTGDDRTVDVHISRLRRKLPSLRAVLTAVRHVGYRLDDDAEVRARAASR